MKRLAVFVFAATAAAQTTVTGPGGTVSYSGTTIISIAASDVTDPFQTAVYARLCFMPVNAAMQPVGYRVGAEQVLPIERCGLVSSGVLQSGLTVSPSPAGAGVYHHIYVLPANGNAILRDYGMANITGSSWTLDTFDPTITSIPVSENLPNGSAPKATLSGENTFALNLGIPAGQTDATGPTRASGPAGLGSDSHSGTVGSHLNCITTASTPVASLTAYGAACNGTTDDTSAFVAAKAALAATSNGGGIIDVDGRSGKCYVANPTALFPASPAAIMTIRISGAGLSLGSTLNEPDNVDIKGNSSAAGSQFQGGGGLIVGPSAGGILGTAITGSGRQTFAPSSMTGLYPGTAITIAETISCTPTSVTSNGNGLVTGVCPSAFHVPPAGQIAVSGGSCTSGFSGKFLINSDDYPSNTVTWKQTIAAGAATGCTLTAFNEDRFEAVQLTATTSTTATATFRLPHASTAVFGIVAIHQTGLSHHIIDSMSFVGASGFQLWLDGVFFSAIHNSYFNGNGGIASGSIENGSQGEIWIDQQSNLAADSLIPSIGYPVGMHMSCAGSTYIEDSYIALGIKHDCPVLYANPSNLVFKNVVFERPGRGAFTYNPVPLNGTGYVNPFAEIQFDRSIIQDNLDGYRTNVPLVYATSGGGGGDLFFNDMLANSPFTALVNSYVGYVIHDRGPSGVTWPSGHLGTYDLGGVFRGEIEGRGASLGPSVIPVATLATNAITCGGASTCYPVLAPDGTNNATEIRCTKPGCAAYSVIGRQSFSTYPGDWFLFGSWVRQGAGQSVVRSAQTFGAYYIATTGTDTFTTGTTVALPYGGSSFNAGDGWYAQVGLATIATGETTSHNFEFRAFPGTQVGQGNQFYYPFWIFIPGPNNPAYAGVTLDEVERLREQVFRGLVPSGYNNPGVATTPLPVSAGGYQVNGVPLATRNLGDWTNTGAANGNVPKWNSTMGKWTPGAVATATSGLSDWSNSGAAAGYVATCQSVGGSTCTAWAPAQPAGGILAPVVSSSPSVAISTGYTAVQNAIKSQGIVADVGVTANYLCYYIRVADNTHNLYDVGLRNSSGTLVAHIGATAGTTFAPAAGLYCLGISGAPITIPPGVYMAEITTNCASSCAAVGSAQQAFFIGTGATYGTTSGGVLPSSGGWPGTAVTPQGSGGLWVAWHN